jgi:hypothetical protein
LLKGGNIKIQSEIYNFFLSNQQSQVFFARIHETLTQEADDTKHGKITGNIETITTILELLQLFAEGHNIDLQLYMKSQTKNYRSYDIISDVVKLLQVYMDTKKKKFFETMLQCFDTLTEYIQGPCYENQQTLIQGPFLETAGTLLSEEDFVENKIKLTYINCSLEKEFEDELNADDLENLDFKDFPTLEPYMFSKLKFKCSITLYSMIESRQSDDIVLR